MSEPDAFTVAEAIASRDLNNLYRVSLFFRDPERYRAFCAYYAVMRVVDDRIDDLPSRSGMSRGERSAEHDVVLAWDEAVRSCYEGGAVPGPVLERCGHPGAARLLDAFADGLGLFRPPPTSWADFFRSMHWDLDHDRFESWADFLRYAQGASVAPTTIFLFLITSRRDGDSATIPAGFDLAECGRRLGSFAYVGHILRDLAEDLGTGDDGLFYVSREDMAAHGVTEESLFSEVERGRAGEATCHLVADLSARARAFLASGRSMTAGLSGHLSPDRAFILELIVTTYERVLDKIEACGFDVMGEAHRLTDVEKRAIVQEVAGRVGFEPARAAE